MLRFFRRYLTPFAWWYVAGTVALVATNWLSVTIPLYLADGVDALQDGGDAAVVTRAAGLVAAMGVVVIAVRTLSRVLFFTPGRLVEARVKRDLFEALLRHQPVFLRQWASGDLYSRVSSDVNMLRLLAGFGVLQAVNAVLSVLLAGGQMVRISPFLAAVMLAPVLAGLVVVQLYIRRLFVLMRRLQVELATLSDHALSTYRGIAAVQGFAAEPAFTERFRTLNEAYCQTLIDRSEIRALLGPTLAISVSLSVFLLLYFGGPMTVSGEISVGELVALTALIAWVSLPLRASSFLVSVIKQAQAALERVDVLLYTPPDRPDRGQGAPAPAGAPRLELSELTFSWPGAETPALQHVSVVVEPGTTLGVLGPTGAGKSTLLSLLARLHNPPRGAIRVDGVDLLDVDLDAWREVVTLVPQRAFLFSESVADNILLGPRDDARLSRALRLTALGPDVEALPRGVDTEVGETGVRLSGGQRQRTALARGLARSYRLLLLDDVLSAVDHATEGQLIGALKQVAADHGATTLLVAHRVSALMHADQVLVLDGGRVVDHGPPAELLRRDGLFRDTWEQQQRDHGDQGSP